jgi:hypothetical protein
MNVARLELIFSTSIFAKNRGESGKHAEGGRPLQRASGLVLAFVREVINEGVSRPRPIQITTHHINAARGTSQNRDSIANMAES